MPVEERPEYAITMTKEEWIILLTDLEIGASLAEKTEFQPVSEGMEERYHELLKKLEEQGFERL